MQNAIAVERSAVDGLLTEIGDLLNTAVSRSGDTAIFAGIRRVRDMAKGLAREEEQEASSPAPLAIACGYHDAMLESIAGLSALIVDMPYNPEKNELRAICYACGMVSHQVQNYLAVLEIVERGMEVVNGKKK